MSFMRIIFLLFYYYALVNELSFHLFFYLLCTIKPFKYIVCYFFFYYTLLFETQYIILVILWWLRPVCVRLRIQILDLCKAVWPAIVNLRIYKHLDVQEGVQNDHKATCSAVFIQSYAYRGRSETGLLERITGGSIGWRVWAGWRDAREYKPRTWNWAMDCWNGIGFFWFRYPYIPIFFAISGPYRARYKWKTRYWDWQGTGMSRYWPDIGTDIGEKPISGPILVISGLTELWQGTGMSRYYTDIGTDITNIGSDFGGGNHNIVSWWPDIGKCKIGIHSDIGLCVFTISGPISGNDFHNGTEISFFRQVLLMQRMPTMILTGMGRWMQKKCVIMKTKIHTFLRLLLPTLDPMPAFFKPCLIKMIWPKRTKCQCRLCSTSTAHISRKGFQFDLFTVSVYISYPISYMMSYPIPYPI